MQRPIRIMLAAAAVLLGACASPRPVRVVTWNVEDLRPVPPARTDASRARAIAGVIRRLDPDVLLLNEIAYDRPEGPGWEPGAPPGSNAQRFADEHLPDLRLTAWMPETNTGEPSGHDLDRSGRAVTTPPPYRPGRPTPEQLAFANDAHGFGVYPGQYAMALLVAPGHRILHDRIRTFRLFRWADMPGAVPPRALDGSPWYTDEAWAAFRLPSKTLAVVPVLLKDGGVLHCVISHPTPPAFDGPEGRNKHRNRDEILLIKAYLENEPWLVDDQGRPGGLPPGAHAVVLGDLNADPKDGDSVGDPIGRLLKSPVLGPDPEPVAPTPQDGLDPWDTSTFGLRVDYVLPSAGLRVVGTGVWREIEGPDGPASDHFPVWAEIIVPDAKCAEPTYHPAP